MTESPQERAKKHRRYVDFGKRQCFKSRLPHKWKARKHGVCEFFFCSKIGFDAYFDAYWRLRLRKGFICAVCEACDDPVCRRVAICAVIFAKKREVLPTVWITAGSAFACSWYRAKWGCRVYWTAYLTRRHQVYAINAREFYAPGRDCSIMTG